jgi:hypothetical protein
MPVALKNAYIGQPGVADTTLYTVPANTTARILKCTVTNDTTTVVTISFNKVPSGDAVGVDNLVMNLKSIGNKETYESPEVIGQVLNSGDLLSAICEAADQLTVSLDVVEIV